MLLFAIASLSLAIWLFLLLFWGQFWRADQKLDRNTSNIGIYPKVGIVIPARNEAELIAQSLTSLLKQDYLGDFSLVLVDDNSTDSTEAIAKKTTETLQLSHKLEIIAGQPSGKG